MSKFNGFNKDSNELDEMDLAFLNGDFDEPIRGNYWEGFFSSIATVIGITILVILLFFGIISIL